MYLEEICLSTTEDDSEVDQSADDRQKVAVLEQANRMRRCQSEFTLFNNHRLSVKSQGFMQDNRDYTVDIGILDSHPKRSLKISWSSVFTFFTLCGAAWFIEFGSLTPNPALLSVILLACAGLSLTMAVFRSHDRIVFYSQHGRVPLVVLFNRSPDRATFDSFINTLIEHVQDAKDHTPDANKTLREELREHRRLMEAEIISRKRYDIVKQRILSQHS